MSMTAKVAAKSARRAEESFDNQRRLLRSLWKQVFQSSDGLRYQCVIPLASADWCLAASMPALNAAIKRIGTDTLKLHEFQRISFARSQMRRQD